MALRAVGDVGDVSRARDNVFGRVTIYTSLEDGHGEVSYWVLPSARGHGVVPASPRRSGLIDSAFTASSFNTQPRTRPLDEWRCELASPKRVFAAARTSMPTVGTT